MGSSWFKPDDEESSVGRDGTWIEEGDLLWGEKYIPNFHEFGDFHDATVDTLTDLGVPDSLANIPTMMPCFYISLEINIADSIVDGIVDAVDYWSSGDD